MIGDPPHDPEKRMSLILRLLILVGLTLPFAASGDSLPDPRQVAPHSYAWIGPYGPPTKENQGFRMNLGLVVGMDAVAVIDSGYGDAMAGAMLEQVRGISDRPVRYVINTNSQPHRILGNAVLKRAGAAVIAAEGAAARMSAEGQSMASAAEGILDLPAGSIQAPGAPDRALTQTTVLDLGGVTLRLIPVGTAHTAGSLIVEVVEDGVVYAGDVLYGGRLLAVLPVSRVDGWISAFDRLRELGDVQFVPGHGESGKLADFEEPTYRYLTTLKSHMDAAVESGADLQEAISSLDQTPWQPLADFDALAGRNAHQTYLEREAASFE
jgi:glyoxylase-like metal-dependent hydrolase (beta-lactamase superfamily II)